MSNETEFETRADNWLEQLFTTLEAQDDEAQLDIELQPGMVEITVDAGQVFIVSKHAPSRQIWLSSPLSGGHHFDADGQGWALKDGRQLSVILAEELRQATGQEFSL